MDPTTTIPDLESYTKAGPNILPTPEAHRFFPQGDDLRTKNTRLVFEGDTHYEPEEEKSYEGFLAYIEQNGEKLNEVPKR
jgi:hypothetical protein